MTWFSLRAYDHTIHINIPLNLPPSLQTTPDYKVSVEDRPSADQNLTWIHNYGEENDDPWFRLGKSGLSYLVRFTNHTDFLIDENKSGILCFPMPNCHHETVEHLLLNQVLPRLLSLKNFLVLHAGAVTSEFGVIGFLGKTGSGKSTITTYFGQNGHPILTDDCLVIRRKQNQFLALPSYPAIRLNPDMVKALTGCQDKLPQVAEYTNKLWLQPRQGRYLDHTTPEVLRALFILDEPVAGKENGMIQIKRCSMREAFSKIIENIFRLDPTDKHYNSKEFDKICALVSSVPVFQLTYTRQISELRKVRQAVLDLLRNLD